MRLTPANSAPPPCLRSGMVTDSRRSRLLHALRSVIATTTSTASAVEGWTETGYPAPGSPLSASAIRRSAFCQRRQAVVRSHAKYRQMVFQA